MTRMIVRAAAITVLYVLMANGVVRGDNGFSYPTAGMGVSEGDEIEFTFTYQNSWVVGGDQYNLDPSVAQFYLYDSDNDLVTDIPDTWTAGDTTTTFTQDDTNAEYYPDAAGAYTIKGGVAGYDVDMNSNVPPAIRVQVNVS